MNVGSFGVVQCSGPDAEKFLQGQLSADIAALSDTHGTLACYLNLKGRVVALMAVLKRPEGFWLILPSDMVDLLIQKLRKFIVFSKATLKDISASYEVRGLIVPPSNETPFTVSQHDNVVMFALSPSGGLQLNIAPLVGKPRPMNVAFLSALIAAHIPWIGPTQSEQFLPHYINLVNLGALSFDKGCYVGQEVVARMHYRGHRDKTLSHMVCAHDEIEQYQGEIVNCIVTPEHTYLLISSTPLSHGSHMGKKDDVPNGGGICEEHD